jgi:transposase
LVAARPAQARALRVPAGAAGQRPGGLPALRGGPWLGAWYFERTLTSADLVGYLKSLPWSKTPRVVVLDNASLHVSALVKGQRQALARQGIYLYYLPAYSPELNEIEAVFKQVKDHEIPQRSYTSRPELREGAEQGFAAYRRKLRPKRHNQLRPAV